MQLYCVASLTVCGLLIQTAFTHSTNINLLTVTNVTVLYTVLCFALLLPTFWRDTVMPISGQLWNRWILKWWCAINIYLLYRKVWGNLANHSYRRVKAGLTMTAANFKFSRANDSCKFHRVNDSCKFQILQSKWQLQIPNSTQLMTAANSKFYRANDSCNSKFCTAMTAANSTFYRTNHSCKFKVLQSQWQLQIPNSPEPMTVANSKFYRANDSCKFQILQSQWQLQFQILQSQWELQIPHFKEPKTAANSKFYRANDSCKFQILQSQWKLQIQKQQHNAL